jgi:hypothetical protein
MEVDGLEPLLLTMVLSEVENNISAINNFLAK